MTTARNLAWRPRSLVPSLHACAVVLSAALGESLGATHALAAGPGEPPSPQTAIAGLIQAAGTTHDELERLRLLRQLDARPDVNATLRADLAKLLPMVDDWANGKSRIVVDNSRAAENGYLCKVIAPPLP